MEEHLLLEVGDIIKFESKDSEALLNHGFLGGDWLIRQVVALQFGRPGHYPYLTRGVDPQTGVEIGERFDVCQHCVDRYGKKLVSGPKREEQAG